MGCADAATHMLRPPHEEYQWNDNNENEPEEPECLHEGHHRGLPVHHAPDGAIGLLGRRDRIRSLAHEHLPGSGNHFLGGSTVGIHVLSEYVDFRLSMPGDVRCDTGNSDA